MNASDTPPPEPSPEVEGIPDYADDTSTAYDHADRPRFSDSPAPFPTDRPQGLDETGVTPAEQREGEPLDDRLAREEPDVSADGGTAETAEHERVEPSADRSAEEAAMHELPEGDNSLEP